MNVKLNLGEEKSQGISAYSTISYYNLFLLTTAVFQYTIHITHFIRYFHILYATILVPAVSTVEYAAFPRFFLLIDLFAIFPPMFSPPSSPKSSFF